MAPEDDEPAVWKIDYSEWAPAIGRWETTAEYARYLGPDDPDEAALGLLIAPAHLGMTRGDAWVQMHFPKDPHEPEPQGRIVFGLTPRANQHYSAGLGGYGSLYLTEHYVPGQGYVALANVGRAESLRRDRDYRVHVSLLGQRAILDVDDVPVIDTALPLPLEGSQVGLTARGRGKVEFHSFEVAHQAPEAFVVMRFGEPYDTLYHEVIDPVCRACGYEPIRADDFSGPGIIIEDIVNGIERSSVVIAEITPVNANVFYELGYAHATGKPTILLADRDELDKLPFDISGRRVIFYEDSISGKPRVESELARHLSSLP